MTDQQNSIRTAIWHEEPEPDNPYAAAASYCSGYDVYGDLLGKVSWVQYLYLLFRLELPDPRQARLLEALSVALANPGIRDPSVQAAMNAGACGSTRASALMAAMAVGAGSLGGGQDLYHALRLWQRLGPELSAWLDAITAPAAEEEDSWQPLEHFPGFDPNGASCPTPLRQTLAVLVDIYPGGALQWLADNRDALERELGYPLGWAGLSAAAFHDLGFDAAQGEILYLLLRLPGAAAHAVEQEQYGWRHFPFFRSALKPMDRDSYSQLLTSIERAP